MTENYTEEERFNIAIKKALYEDADFKRAAELIREQPQYFDRKHNGLYYFEYAASQGRVDVLEFLLGQGIDIKDRLMSAPYGGTLYKAALNGHLETIRWLLEHGAEPNQAYEDETYSISLAVASGEGHLDCVKLLVEGGALVNGCCEGKNALYFAEVRGHKEIAVYLRSKGAKLPAELGDACPNAQPIAQAPAGKQKKRK